ALAARPAPAPPRTLEVLFVDDGSQDGTAALLQAAFAADPRVRILRQPHHRGLGAALRSGLAAAQGEVLLTTDCDGSYRFAELPALLARLTPAVDLVTASPYHPQGAVAGVPAHRLLFSRAASACYRLLVGGGLHTYTALCRAYRRELVQQVPIPSDGYLGLNELLVGALLAGYRVAEYPCLLHGRSQGASKTKLLRTTRAHLGLLLRLLGQRRRGRGRRAQAAALPRAEAGRGGQP